MGMHVAAAWPDSSERDFSWFPHAQRSREVGGYTVRMRSSEYNQTDNTNQTSKLSKQLKANKQTKSAGDVAEEAAQISEFGGWGE